MTCRIVLQPRMWRDAVARARKARHNKSGVAAVEFALILPVLLALTMAAIEFSRYIGTRVELEQAVRAGAQYALRDHSDTTTITSAVQNATDLSGISVSIGSLVCECPNGASTPCPGGATYPTCLGGVEPSAFLTITATTTYEPIFGYLPWFTSSMSVQQPLTMRVM